MHDTPRFLSAALALAAGATLLACTATDDRPDPPDEVEAAAPPADADMMARMMELATPGDAHAELTRMAGQWDVHYRMRWTPDAEWMETTGQAEMKSLLGGRYMLESVKFEMMGTPMEGMNLMGYDKMKGEYTSLWADSMSTWWVTSRGKEQKDGSIDFRGTMVDVAGERPFRMVVRHESDDLIRGEMYDTIPPHGEIKVMEMTSKRRK